MTGTLILVRHGQSVWNAENRFTGWVDVALTERGRREAVRAGELLSEAGLLPDVVHTSLLRRAVDTANLMLEAAGWWWVPQHRSWRLNERHYGALAGLDRAATAAEHGEAQVHRWRRSFGERPPQAGDIEPFRADARYRDVPDSEMPRGESLADVAVRLMPYWSDTIVPQLERGDVVLVVAHGNSLRALAHHIESLTVEEVEALEIPTATPRVYRCETRGEGLRFAAPEFPGHDDPS